MARTTQAERVKTWQNRIRSASKLYDAWAKKFDTDRLEKYYNGEQWRGYTDDEARDRYTINMVFASIETNKPSLVFDKPQVKFQPRPGRLAQFGNNAEIEARLSENAVQTFIDDPDVEFTLNTALSLHEAHFRFGVVEVGYSADWIDNPNAGRPVLKENEEVKDSQGRTVMQPAQITNRESIYVKHIPASTFRVSISSKNALATNDWVGYFEWHYLEDIKANPEYHNTANLTATGVVKESIREEDSDDLHRHHGMVKLWKIWDLRRGVRHVVVEGYDKFLVEDRPYKFLPFAVIKFHEVLNEFYPLPPVFQWLGPQDEVNEVRDAQRAHRARFYRRYTRVKGSVDDAEWKKFETGGDGVCIEVNIPDPVHPVADAPLSADVWRHLDESKNDFLAVSGTIGERNIVDADTATQANIVDVRSRLREASARQRVSTWLSLIARLMLMSIREYMTLPFWVRIYVDSAAVKDPGEVLPVIQRWKEITAEDLGNIDMEISIELASLSPVTQDAQRAAWNQVLMLLKDPMLVALFAQSEVLLRKTLSLYGITDENDIREIQKVCLNAAAGMQAQAESAAMAAAAGEGGPMGKLPVMASGNGSPPSPPNPPAGRPVASPSILG